MDDPTVTHAPPPPPSGWSSPSAPQPQPASTPPKKKGGKRKWIVGGVVVVLALAAIGAAAKEPNASDAMATSTPGTTPTSEPTASDPGDALVATAEPAEAITPEPTEAVTPEPTQAPPADAFEAFTLKGKGNKVAKFTIPEDTAAIAVISETGSSNFVVESIASDGTSNDLLVNEIGSYKGTVLFDDRQGEHSVAFKISSNGTWSIVVKPVTQATGWNPATAVKGTGSQVLRLTASPDSLAVVKITHKGSSNFVVYAFGTDGTELLVNEIGNYSGETILPDSTVLVTIEADGTWTITPG